MWYPFHSHCNENQVSGNTFFWAAQKNTVPFMHGACLPSRYTQSVVNWTDGHQADGKAFGWGFDSAFKSALLQRLVVVLSKSVSFMKITHTTQQVNATDTNIFILIVFHSVFSRTRLKCQPSNEYENWTKCFVKNCQKILNTGLFISPSGTFELDCATTKIDRAERSISIGTESLKVFFCTRGLGVLADSTARG